MDLRPGTRKIMLPGKSSAELLAVLKNELSGKTVKRIGMEEFKAEFEAAYARDMAWRDAKGGVSQEEFDRVAKSQQMALSDDALRDGFKETKLGEIVRWSSEAIEEFAKTTTLTVAQWQEFEGKMCIFHSDLYPSAYVAYLWKRLKRPRPFLDPIIRPSPARRGRPDRLSR